MVQVKLHKLSYTADELDARLAKIDENFAAIAANTDADNEFKESVTTYYATKEELASYQPAGDYAYVTDIPSIDGLISETTADEKYQAKGNYQPAGDYATKEELSVVAKQVGPAVFSLNIGSASNMSNYAEISNGAELFKAIRDNFVKGIPTLIVNGSDAASSSVDDNGNPITIKTGDVYSCIYIGTNQFNYATIENWSNKRMCLLRIQGLLDSNKKVIGAQYQTSLLTY